MILSHGLNKNMTFNIDNYDPPTGSYVYEIRRVKGKTWESEMLHRYHKDTYFDFAQSNIQSVKIDEIELIVILDEGHMNGISDSITNDNLKMTYIALKPIGKELLSIKDIQYREEEGKIIAKVYMSITGEKGVSLYAIDQFKRK